MNLSNSFNPVPKPTRTKNPNRKRKKVERVKGVTIPSRRVRGQIDKKNYDKAMDLYEYSCGGCGTSVGLEMHHIVFRSQIGRKGYRNLVPLCNEHHRLCHTSFEYAESWREKHLAKYGPWFASDKWDLFKAGMISNTTDECFERFMRSEQRDEMGE